jgi:hypothetical protein
LLDGPSLDVNAAARGSSTRHHFELKADASFVEERGQAPWFEIYARFG